MNNIFRRIQQSGILISIGLATAANGFALSDIASQLRSEFKLNLPSSVVDGYVTKTVVGLSGSKVMTWPSYVTTGDIPVTVTDISATVHYAMQSPQTLATGERWHLSATQTGVTIQVAKLNASQTITVVKDGAHLSIQVAAECDDVKLTLPDGKAKIDGDLVTDLKSNNLSLTSTNVSWSWQASDWQISIGSCSGVDGLQNLVRAKALELVTSQTLIGANLNAYVQSELSHLNQTFVQWMSTHALPVSIPNVTLSATPTTIAFSKAAKSFELGGTLNFSFAKIRASQNSSSVIRLEKAALAPVPTASTARTYLTIPLALTASLINHLRLNGSLVHWIYANSYPAFQQLLSSPVLSIFFWPDLIRFSSQIPFEVGLQIAKGVDLSFISSATVQTGLRAMVQTRVEAPFYYVSNSNYMPYVKFSTDASGEVELTVENGSIVTRLLTVSPISLRSDWDPNYDRHVHPDHRIALATIGKNVRSALLGQVFKFPIPSFNLSTQFAMSPQSIRQNSGNMEIDLDLREN